ncbi:hypothetical protein [Streptomyces sp. HUAS TT7]|uniref:hypothetical protein n=1 Tax=Streptomyces sp. HUAS TT7 TaxID=3447507 RepID=UPI003F65E670
MRHPEGTVLPGQAPPREAGCAAGEPQLVRPDPQEHLAWAEGPEAGALGGVGFM